VLDEIKLMSLIRSPHVIRLEASHARNDEIFIIMELAESGSIADLIKERKDLSSRFDEDDLWRCLVQVFCLSIIIVKLLLQIIIELAGEREHLLI